MSESPPVTIESLKRHFRGEEELYESFSSLLENCERVNLEKLVQEVDASDYSMKDWAEAFLAFEMWLTVKKIKKKDFVDMLGYFSCCLAMIAKNVDRPNLQLFVNQCLTDYGFEAANSSQE